MELSQYHFSREQKPCSVSVLIGSRCICIQKLINLELKQILFQSFFERFLFYKMLGDKTPSPNRKLTVVHKMDTLYRFLYIIWVWILYSSDIVLLMEQVLLLCQRYTEYGSIFHDQKKRNSLLHWTTYVKI